MNCCDYTESNITDFQWIFVEKYRLYFKNSVVQCELRSFHVTLCVKVVQLTTYILKVDLLFIRRI